MSVEELRGLADTLKIGMESGEYGLGTMEDLVDAALVLTDPTPVDAEKRLLVFSRAKGKQ